MRVPGWRALGLFWLGVAVLLGGGSAWLARLGPPEAVMAEGNAADSPAPAAGAGATTPAAAAVPPAPGADPAAASALPPATVPSTTAAATPPSAAPDTPAAPSTPTRTAAAPTAPQTSAPAAPPAAAPTASPTATPTAPPAASVPAPPAASVPAPPAATPPATTASPPPAAPDPPPLSPAAVAPRGTPRPIPPPDPGLLEAGRHGMLPRIGADGRTAIRAYGREFDRSDTRPRIGIVVADMGLSASPTEDAIRRLPPAVALAISPYAPRPAQAAERARERGMETLIAIPLEPTGYPLNDPGDRALLTGRGMAENLDQLDWSLARFQGYVGAIGVVAGMRGERFAALPEAIGAVQDVLLRRGVLYVDPRPGAAPPARAWGRGVDVVLDEPARTRGEIDRRLAELEQVARDRGTALGLAGAPTVVLVDSISAWAAGLDQRGLVLAPVSALIRRPTAPGNAQGGNAPGGGAQGGGAGAARPAGAP